MPPLDRKVVMAVEVGAVAPDFALVDTERSQFQLSSTRGQKTLLVFIPFPWTGICDGEACSLRDHFADLNALAAQVVIVTTYPQPALRKWASENGFRFPVLSDFWPHGEVGRQYGVFDEKRGAHRRATFVLDADGVVREIVASESLGTPREHEAYEAALKRI